MTDIQGFPYVDGTMACGFLGSLSDVFPQPLVLRVLPYSKHLLFQPFHFQQRVLMSLSFSYCGIFLLQPCFVLDAYFFLFHLQGLDPVM